MSDPSFCETSLNNSAEISNTSGAPVVSGLAALAARIACLPTYDGNDLGCSLRRVDLPVGTGIKNTPVILIGAEHRDAIVRAVNSHDVLVRALERIASSLDLESYPDNGSLESMLGNVARAALASAREAQS